MIIMNNVDFKVDVVIQKPCYDRQQLDEPI